METARIPIAANRPRSSIHAAADFQMTDERRETAPAQAATRIGATSEHTGGGVDPPAQPVDRVPHLRPWNLRDRSRDSRTPAQASCRSAAATMNSGTSRARPKLAVEAAPLENPRRKRGAAGKSDADAERADERLVRRHDRWRSRRRKPPATCAVPSGTCAATAKPLGSSEQRQSGAHARQCKAECAGSEDRRERDQHPLRRECRSGSSALRYIRSDRSP